MLELFFDIGQSLHIPDSLTIPHWRSVVRHAIPNVVEGKLIPAAMFIALFQMAGTRPALLGALSVALLAMGSRVARKKSIPGLLWLTTLALIARTVAALATGSVVIYFLQPTIATCLVGGAFLVSVLVGRPLAERLALDFFPLDDATRNHPVVRRFFRDVSLWWGFTSLVNFSITLWLLLSHSPTTFVLVKSVLGPATTTVTLTVAFFWFRSLMSRTGTEVVFGDPRARLVVPVTVSPSQA